jgi:hypothetical protein
VGVIARRGGPAGANAPSLELRIDEVVLRGFSPGDGDRIGAAIERELRRLLAERALGGDLAGDVHLDELDGGGFDLPPGARGEEVGALIARAVYSRLRSAMAGAGALEGPGVGVFRWDAAAGGALRQHPESDPSARPGGPPALVGEGG